MVQEQRIGIIGLDTSHTVAFTKLLQGDAPPEQKVDGMRVVKAMRFPSVFQTEEGQNDRQAQLEKWGVTMVDTVADVLRDVDAIFLEINDPALHLEYFEKVAACGKPIFLDKPLASSLESGRKIAAIAQANSTRVWSASSLRFTKKLVSMMQEISEPLLCNVYGPLGKAAAGSDLVWYGCHATEMLTTIMGTGAQSVWAKEDSRGIVAIVNYGNARRGIIECNREAYQYGGRAQSADKLGTFDIIGDVLYYNLLLKLREFLVDGRLPVAMEETLEIQAIMDAAERSLASGQEETLG
jgi:predicted dehydrogenase